MNRSTMRRFSASTVLAEWGETRTLGMSHSVREKQKLINRIKRIRGQVGAVEELLAEDIDCERALHTLAACRGAINALMAEILEDHVRYHVLPPDSAPGSHEHQAAEQLVDIIRSYLK